MPALSAMIALGVDLGTTGVRAVALDRAGHPLAMTRTAYGPRPAHSADPERWWQAAQKAIRDVVAALSDAEHDPSAIMGICVDGTSGSVVLTDGALRPIGRALMYNQTGFDAEADRIARVAPVPHITRGLGSSLARVLRLCAEDTSRSARYLCHQADLVTARLLNRGGNSDFHNALKTGFDPATGSWPDWFSLLGFDQTLLPQPHPPGTALGRVAPGVAETLGLPPETMVHAGTTDSAAAFLAASPPGQGAAVTSLGTTMVVMLHGDHRIDAPEIGLYSQRLPTGWLIGGASNTGAGILRHFFSVEALNTLCARIDPGVASPLDYYPLLGPGERFPINDPGFAPRLAPRPADDAAFLHGLLESMARIERQCYAEMVARGAPAPLRVLTVGGGAANTVWSRIRSRVLGVPVTSASRPEAVLGTAALVFDGA